MQIYFQLGVSYKAYRLTHFQKLLTCGFKPSQNGTNIIYLLEIGLTIVYLRNNIFKVIRAPPYEIFQCGTFKKSN